MALGKKLTNRLSLMRKDRRKKGISSVISTLIITGALLIILVIASFVATNILSLQMADSEFQQAQSNMLLLDSVIQDVSLRQGAGSNVQFNQITGGIGTSTDTSNKLNITVGQAAIFTSYPLTDLVYRGGTSTSGAAQTLKGDSAVGISVDQPIGYLRVETGNSVKIKLDYNRVRVVEMGQQLVGSIPYNFTAITFIQLKPGQMGGSDTVDVKVQNVAVKTSYFNYANVAQDSSVQACLTSNNQPTTLLSIKKGDNVMILLSVVEVQVSIG